MRPTLSEHRLHPVALLLTLGKHVKDAALALVSALFASSTGDGAIAGIPWQAIVGGLTILLVLGPTLVHYLTFRYRFDHDELVIRWGWLRRGERHVPFVRIQSLDAHEGVLHRLVGAVGVVLETGGGGEAEGEISAISRSAFEEMRERVRRGREEDAPAITTETEAAIEPATVINEFTDNETLLAGLVLGRGMLVIGTVMAVMIEMGVLRPVMEWMFGDSGHDGRLSSIVSRIEIEDNYFVASLLIGVLLLGFVALVRLLASVMTAVRFHRHRLVQQGEDLRVTCGMITRSHSTTPIRRIQSVTVIEGPWHRLTRRVTVQAGSAGGGANQRQVASRETIVPLLRTAALPRVMTLLLRGLEPPESGWRSASPRAWKRMIVPQLLGWCVPVGLMLYIHWTLGAVGVVLFGVSLGAAIVRVRRFRWMVFEGGAGIRSGWLWQHTTWVRFDRVQLAVYSQSPFDRRHDMATVSVDTAGNGAPGLAMRFLAERDAADVVERLNAGIAATEFAA